MKTAEQIESRIEGMKSGIAFHRARIDGYKREVAELAAQGIMDFGAPMNGIKTCERNIAGLATEIDALKWVLETE